MRINNAGVYIKKKNFLAGMTEGVTPGSYIASSDH